jgi:hypothetical protein
LPDGKAQTRITKDQGNKEGKEKLNAKAAEERKARKEHGQGVFFVFSVPLWFGRFLLSFVFPS